MSGNVRDPKMQRINSKELADAFIAEQIKEIKEQVGDKKVLLALSGGVDSSVCAALLIKAIGNNLTCVHVNHGLLRKGESEQVIKGIKAHHNVGGLPAELNFELVEPVKLLYKDEVRQVGEALGLPHSMVYRQPFPGPGLGVRCVGAITRDRLEAVRESDAILREEFAKAGLDQHVWQYFTIVPPIKSTGIKDGKRTFEWPVVIRAINSVDAVTASIEEIPYALLGKIRDRILSEVKGVNRVLYDLSNKPVATIEWE